MNTIALLNPEIPPNTGTIARLCAVTNTKLHLVGTLGFELSDKYLKRASMDYWQYVQYELFPDLDAYIQALDVARASLFSTKGTQLFSEAKYTEPSILLFGNESSGAPQIVHDSLKDTGQVLRIPMLAQQRSINIALSVGIALYEVLRQQGYKDLG